MEHAYTISSPMSLNADTIPNFFRADLKHTYISFLPYVGLVAPYRGGIVYLGPYYCVVSCLTYAFVFGLNFSSYEAQGPICFRCHILYTGGSN